MFRYKINEALYLKLPQISDAQELFDLINRNRYYLKKWLPWVDLTKTKDDSVGFIKSVFHQLAENKGFQAFIEYEGEIVGVIGLHGINNTHRFASIGYWLSEDAQGRGIMTKSTEAVVDYVFNEMAFNRVEIRCASGNIKSQNIPKRLGFTEEGVVRCAENLYGKYVDHIIYGMIKDEWKKS